MCSAPFAPIVVAKYTWTGQTSNLSTTTVYTPSSDGDFVVYLSGEATNLHGGEEFELAWTGNRGSYNAQGNLPYAGTIGYSFTYSFHAQSGQPITIEVLASGGTSETWDLSVIVEQH